MTGLEPATSCVTGRRSNQLSYTPGKGRENVTEVFSRSSGSAKKMIRTTDAKEVGVGNTAEETCRCPNQKEIFLPKLSYKLLPPRVLGLLVPIPKSALLIQLSPPVFNTISSLSEASFIMSFASSTPWVVNLNVS